MSTPKKVYAHRIAPATTRAQAEALLPAAGETPAGLPPGRRRYERRRYH